MRPDVRLPLAISAHARRIAPKSIIEEAIVEFVSSGDFDTAMRYPMDESYQGCTYRVDIGVADQLRRISRATGESMQTVLHEALTRKLNIETKETPSHGNSNKHA